MYKLFDCFISNITAWIEVVTVLLGNYQKILFIYSISITFKLFDSNDKIVLSKTKNQKTFFRRLKKTENKSFLYIKYF